ncbi:MAG: hypothetical protein FJ225_06825 [Lentisphaerae bacterium]|nr:hypothetical protein [Lentisphaerota bacterium]
MKRVVAMLCIVGLLALLPAQAFCAEEKAPAKAAEKGKGGLPAFFIGCCLGIREGTEWNEGKELHWREWVHLPLSAGAMIPYVGFIFGAASGVMMIWNGIECGTGTTAHQFAEKYGTNWY